MDSFLEDLGALYFFATPYSLRTQEEVATDMKGYCAHVFPNQPYTDGIKNVLEHRDADESFERYIAKLAIFPSSIHRVVLSINVDPVIFDSPVHVARLKEIIERTRLAIRQIVVSVPPDTDRRLDSICADVGVKVSRPILPELTMSPVGCSYFMASVGVQAVWDGGLIAPDHPQYKAIEAFVAAMKAEATGAELDPEMAKRIETMAEAMADTTCEFQPSYAPPAGEGARAQPDVASFPSDAPPGEADRIADILGFDQYELEDGLVDLDAKNEDGWDEEAFLSMTDSVMRRDSPGMYPPGGEPQ